MLKRHLNLYLWYAHSANEINSFIVYFLSLLALAHLWLHVGGNRCLFKVFIPHLYLFNILAQQPHRGPHLCLFAQGDRCTFHQCIHFGWTLYTSGEPATLRVSLPAWFLSGIWLPVWFLANIMLPWPGICFVYAGTSCHLLPCQCSL